MQNIMGLVKTGGEKNYLEGLRKKKMPSSEYWFPISVKTSKKLELKRKTNLWS
jgi:hypothetical protein